MSEPGTVVVVGGAGAIGSAVVERYLERGVGVLVIDKEPVAANAHCAPLHHLQADVTRDDEIARACASAEDLSLPIRHLVSLAGGAFPREFGSLVDTDVETIRRSVELNLTSHVLLTRAFLPLLGYGTTGSGGDGADRSVTLISSINAFRDYGLPAYSAGKSGMFGFVRAMAGELGAVGIRINVVAPGTVSTPGTQRQPKDHAALRRSTVLGRLAEPSDIAAAIVAMSHDFRAVTGQYLIVDCGQTVASPPWRLAHGTARE